MYRVNYLKREHEEIFRNLLELEEMINQEEHNHTEIYEIFQRITKLLVQHEQNEIFLLNEVNNDYYLNAPIRNVLLDPRKIKGHMTVINNALASKDPNFIRVSLDNDGRMFISKVKEQIFREEKVFDKLLFLHIVQ